MRHSILSKVGESIPIDHIANRAYYIFIATYNEIPLRQNRWSLQAVDFRDALTRK